MPDVPALPHEPYSTSNQNLFPATPSQYARPSPFVTHPSRCQPDVGQIEETNRRWAKNSVLNFVPNRVKWAEDFGVRERRFGHGKQDAEHLELEWAAWLEMTGEQKVDQSTVAWVFESFASFAPPPPPLMCLLCCSTGSGPICKQSEEFL